MQSLSASVFTLLLLNCLVDISAMSPSERRYDSKICSNATQATRCENSCLKECICRDGRDGRDGRNGKDGRDGRDGRNAGVKGEKGEQGAPGDVRMTAIKGEKGAQGLPGDDGMKGIKGEQGVQGLPGDDGMEGIKGNKGGQGFKGQKGEPGLSFVRKHRGGIFKFDDVSVNCTPSTAGTVTYNVSQNALQFCDGRSWLLLLTAPAADPKKVKQGHEPQKPGRHCLDILKAGHGRGNGLYWIDPNGGSTDDSFQAFCDMETDGGGWTLVATKVSPSFLFIKTTFSASAARTTDADAASHIHPNMGDWEEVMFRFSDVNTIRVIYNRNTGAPNKDKINFNKFLMGAHFRMARRRVHGFYKYSPANINKRNASLTFASISKLSYVSDYGISESHIYGTDKWLDMYRIVDYSDNYHLVDDSRARGTKCIAGYCYLNKPIWVMVR